jgi:hypothetical protein
MKTFLILFLVSLNCFAQYKVEIKNLKGEVTHSGEFLTLPEVEAWVASHAPTGDWGRPDKLVSLDGATDEDRALAIEVIPANEKTKTPSMLRTRANFIVSDPVDVSAQKAAEKQALQDAQSTRALLIQQGCPAVKAASTTALKLAAAADCLDNIIKTLKTQ